jgi:asparagine synthase (glutamine-hydrolysing)
MCGICGIVRFNEERDDLEVHRRVQAMVASLAHRGPDGAGVAASGACCFGAARLAIRGPEDGRQPMRNQTTGVLAVCNGEIDNHGELRRWLATRGRDVPSATDVAVIVPLYLELGEAFIERLAGAFALAIWDPRTELLLLARDRAGERFLFMALDGGTALFATELSALAVNPGLSLAISKPAVARYLERGYFEAPASPFIDVQKVAPAEIVRIERNGVSRRRYWQWRIHPRRLPVELEPTFDETFRAVVRRQTEVDTKCGVFLSGGLDSSLVAAVARSIRPDQAMKAYTLRFSEPSYDEGNYAQRVAELLGMESISVLVEPESFPAELARLVRLVGEPVADQSWIPTALHARRAAADGRLALVGEGADEIFGGYPTYLGAGLGRHYGRIPVPLRSVLERLVDAWPPSAKKVSISFLLKRFVKGWDLDGVSRHLLWTSNLPPASLSRLVAAPPPPRLASEASAVLLDAVQEQDFRTSLAEALLAEKDRGSMSEALELRSPFLDPEVLAFAAALPPAERVCRITTKVFLKRYALRYLPPHIVYRKKRGLSVPLDTWLRGPLCDWADARLRSKLLDEVGINSVAASDLLSEHCRREADHSRALWTLIVLSEWLEWAATAGHGRSFDPAPAVIGR